MPMTFESVWRAVLAHCPMAGALLCREWVQWAYEEYGIARAWSDLRVESAITVADQRSGTCTPTQGSAIVAGGTLLFTAADVGRQFRISSIPIYTIVSVSLAGGTSATLNRTWQEASGLVTATILDAYVTMPLDFARFLAVTDPPNKWRLRWWISSDVLNRYDPGRMGVGNARMLVNQSYSPVASAAGQVRYELYPYQTSARSYPMWYFKKAPILSDDDVFLGPLANRAKDVLVEGALSRCALWPGISATQKNPYFNLPLAKAHEDRFREKTTTLQVADDDLYFEDLPASEFAYAEFPWDAAWLQTHEPEMIG